MKFNKQEFDKELKSLAIPLASQNAFVMTLFSGALTGVDSIFLVPDQLRKKREHPPGCKVFPGFYQNQ